jgi:hypothetical protein
MANRRQRVNDMSPGEKFLRLVLLVLAVTYYEVITIAALMIGLFAIPLQRPKENPCKIGHIC